MLLISVEARKAGWATRLVSAKADGKCKRGHPRRAPRLKTCSHCSRAAFTRLTIDVARQLRIGRTPVYPIIEAATAK